MKTLAILSRKGGTGKTTLATHLSVAAERAGHTAALIDLDPQSSAAKWRDNRDGDTPAVISTHSERLSQILQARRGERGDVRDSGYRAAYRDRGSRCRTRRRYGVSAV